MTKKDYELIAKALHHSLDATMDEQRKGVLIAIDFVVTALEMDNARFQPAKFKHVAID